MCQGIWISEGGLKTIKDIEPFLIEQKYSENYKLPVYISTPSFFRSEKLGEKGRDVQATLWGCWLSSYMIERLVSGIVCQSEKEKELILILLQAARLRTTVTEYISCPSCGRTLFDLETTTARIKQATSHLPGIKIAVMGCIVNGPGEMADADYGYVGAAQGKVTLYRGKSVVKKNIDSKDAVDELIGLIQEDGHWKDPVTSIKE